MTLSATFELSEGFYRVCPSPEIKILVLLPLHQIESFSWKSKPNSYDLIRIDIKVIASPGPAHGSTEEIL